MIKARSSYLSLLLVVFISTCSFKIGFCELQLEESRLIAIKVTSNGSATWTVTRRYLLKTEDDAKIFQQYYLLDFEDKKEELRTSFANDTLAMVNRASDVTGRNMTAKNFEVDAGILQTPTESLGIIEYQCTWVGFAYVKNAQIQIGDVFEAGFFLLENNELTVTYPLTYQVSEVRPPSDVRMDSERTLTWYGPQSFGAQEPRVLLEEKTSGVMDALLAYWPLIVLAAVGISLSSVFFFRFEKRRKVPQMVRELETDEDHVIRLLKAAGGKAYQSTIGEKCGFSRSKTSQLLKEMENSGIVRREKRGRQKLVVLLQENS